MSDIYFHTYITDLTAAEQTWLAAKLTEYSDGQFPTVYGEVENGALHLYSDEESPAELDVVAEMLQEFILKFRPAETIKFGYARICEPNEDESGGGVIIVTADGNTWRSTDEWLTALPKAERGDDIVADLGEPAAEGADTLAIDSEQFHDDYIAPALVALSEQCAANGLSLLAFCEYGDGYGHTRRLAPDASTAMRFIDAAGQANGNFDALALAVYRWAKAQGLVDTSLVLGLLGRVGNE